MWTGQKNMPRIHAHYRLFELGILVQKFKKGFICSSQTHITNPKSVARRNLSNFKK